MHWETKPFVAFGPIGLTNNLDDIVQIIGPFDSKRKIGSKTKYIWQSKAITATFSKDVLQEVSVLKNEEILPEINGFDLFHDDAAGFLKVLEGANGGAEIAHGILIFRKLGITLSGVHDNDDSQAAVSVFTKERLDLFKVAATAISFV